MTTNFDVSFEESEQTFNTDFKGVETLKGDRGYSAYEIAVQNGFVGTESEWLESLKGADGYTPIKGVDYFDGAKGDKGDPYELTEADKTEIINGVLEAMPNGDEVAY